MTKHEFVTQYTLNRALTVSANISVGGVLGDALRAWEEIEQECPPEQPKPRHSALNVDDFDEDSN